MTEHLNEIGLSPESIALARALLLGDKSLLDAATVDAFRGAGMAHLLAVSGLHVGVLAAVVRVLLLPLRYVWQLAVGARSMWLTWHLPRLVLDVFTLAAVWGYVIMIGCPVSAVRAALMGTLYFVSRAVRQPFPLWHVWLAPACVMLCYEGWPPSPGYVLSFAAVAGIFLSQPWLADRRLPALWRLMLLTLGAQALTLPWVAYYFERVPVFGLLQSVVVVPLLFPLVLMLLVALVLPHGALTDGLVTAVEVIRNWMEDVAHFTLRAEQLLLGGHLRYQPTLWEALLATLFFLALLLMARRYYK